MALLGLMMGGWWVKAGPPTGMVGNYENTISYTSAIHQMECLLARSLLIWSQTLIEERVGECSCVHFVTKILTCDSQICVIPIQFVKVI